MTRLRKILAAGAAAAVLSAGVAAPADAAPPWSRYKPCTNVVHTARVFWRLPAYFDNIASRESLCIPWARSGTRDTGAWQINDVNIPYLQRMIPWMPRTKAGAIAWLKDPYNNGLAVLVLRDYWRRATGDPDRPWR